jgi:hypothetical protein
MRSREKPGAMLREVQQLQREAAERSRSQQSGIRSHVLATFSRGELEELRLTLDSRPNDDGRVISWVSARIWWRGNDGEMRPSKKGVTFRVRELGEVVARLEDAIARVQR